MLAATSTLARMSRNRSSATLARTRAIAAHMSTGAGSPLDQPVLFQSNGCARTYVLNRAKKLNALNSEMINSLRSQLHVWSKSDLCHMVIGTGLGRAFCAGGDVATVLKDSLNVTTRPAAIQFFKDEFELDLILSQLPKPYVAVLDGITMGGGVGLSIGAPFRIATEKTVFAMPETKIGYCPDVGASFFLSRMDGELGTYLALTSETLVGREVFELGLATHYVPSRTIPDLMARLAEYENPSFSQIDCTIEELHSERQPDEPTGKLTGAVRNALDSAFGHNSVEMILESLATLSSSPDTRVSGWAKQTLETLHMRSPTSLKVALAAIRRGVNMSLRDALQMEMGIATAYCSDASPDFCTGISAVLVDKIQERPAWSPNRIEDVPPEILDRFFSDDSSYRSQMPQLTFPDTLDHTVNPMAFALPSESRIVELIRLSCKDGPVSLSALLSDMENLIKEKLGTKEKVLDVVQRRCQVVDEQETTIVAWKE
ncbi:3-hydroxyisobutyryl-coenzyme A hydrolase [Boletus edulis BED1]|uniref:3-hydroxyisobutyryl-CoA hydrolase n=1 Tax=Boletus edulis BED1 TaxID=1328754 RepID=A0AAD4C470_BOLED|nr:3-hydroxyisobutyryl-coenzyme A hydrolase [Boletus edulis BED1]